MIYTIKMGKEDVEKIVSEKGGELIKYTEDVFEEIELKCGNNHLFSLYENDINLGNWCELCQNSKDKIEEILDKLKIEYTKDIKINNIFFKYAIEGKRKFLIYDFSDDFEIRFDTASKEGYKSIVLYSVEDPEIEKKIWEGIKDNKDITYIGELEKTGHNCQILTVLQEEKDDTGSIIKEAPKPYPVNVNYAIGYIRVSTSMQVQDGFSLDAQENKIATESEKHNLFLRGLYIDKGISGGSTEKRLALENMRENLKEGDWIIVNSVSRLARNTKDLLSMVEEIEQKKCHLIIIDLNMDITSPSGKLILTLMASQAQFERELTSERVKGVLQHLKKMGSLRTKPSFGWKINPDRSKNAPIHIRDEDEQKIIKEIRLVRNKFPKLKITALTEKLNQLKITPPRKSQKWYHKTLKMIMEREGIN